MGNQYGRRREPPATKGLATVLNRAFADSGLPDPTREQINTFGRLLEKQLADIGSSAYLGQPAPHSHEDDSSGGELDDGAELLAMLAFQRAGC